MKTIKLLVILVLFCAMIVIGGKDSWSWGDKNGSPEKGKIIYNKLKCYYCHKIGGQGGNTGPDLTKEGTKKRGIAWQINNLVASPNRDLKHPSPDMPQFDKLTDKMLLDLASYLESLK